MKNKTIKNIFILVTVTIVLVFTIKIIIPLMYSFNEMKLTETVKKEKEDIIKNEYTNLFNPEFRTKISVWNKILYNSKHPFAAFNYENYHIDVHKINFTGAFKSEHTIAFKKEDIKQTPDVNYTGYEVNSFKFLLSSKHDSIASNIFGTYSDTLLQTINIGDTITVYKFLGTNLSIRYEVDEAKDFLYINGKSNIYEKKPKKIFLDLIIYKKHKYLYYIIIYSRIKGNPIEENLPYILF